MAPCHPAAARLGTGHAPGLAARRRSGRDGLRVPAPALGTRGSEGYRRLIVVNAFAEPDVVKAWGDGTTVAADGTQVETYIDNLPAETSIRYGGVGGIAYSYVSDTYVAPF